jgi:hypothetical protein
MININDKKLNKQIISLKRFFNQTELLLNQDAE